MIDIEKNSDTGAEVRTQFSVEEEDDLLQFAIQQSLIEAGSERDEVGGGYSNLKRKVDFLLSSSHHLFLFGYFLERMNKLLKIIIIPI